MKQFAERTETAFGSVYVQFIVTKIGNLLLHVQLAFVPTSEFEWIRCSRYVVSTI